MVLVQLVSSMKNNSLYTEEDLMEYASIVVITKEWIAENNFSSLALQEMKKELIKRNMWG